MFALCLHSGSVHFTGYSSVMLLRRLHDVHRKSAAGFPLVLLLPIELQTCMGMGESRVTEIVSSHEGIRQITVNFLRERC